MNIAQISVANNVFEYAFIDQIPFFKIAIEISRNITVFHIRVLSDCVFGTLSFPHCKLVACKCLYIFAD